MWANAMWADFQNPANIRGADAEHKLEYVHPYLRGSVFFYKRYDCDIFYRIFWSANFLMTCS